MSELVSPEEIERIVGASRHDTEHYGRAVSSAKTVFILHSAQCKASTADLRDCVFSLALDQGIDQEVPWSRWRFAEDRAVVLELVDGWLMPRTEQETTPTETAARPGGGTHAEADPAVDTVNTAAGAREPSANQGADHR